MEVYQAADPPCQECKNKNCAIKVAHSLKTEYDILRDLKPKLHCSQSVCIMEMF